MFKSVSHSISASHARSMNSVVGEKKSDVFEKCELSYEEIDWDSIPLLEVTFKTK